MTTTQSPKGNQLEREMRFLKALYTRLGIKPDKEEEEQDQKQNTDNGAKAVLKRAMSGEPRYISKTYEFLPYTGEKSQWKEKNIWIPVACLSVFYPQPLVETERRQNFGYSCWLLQQEIQRNSPDAKGVSRRFRALLDTSLEDIQTPLTALVRQMKAMKMKKMAIDYPKLLADLQRWETSDYYVQDQWAKSFWGASALPLEEPPSQNDDA